MVPASSGAGDDETTAGRSGFSATWELVVCQAGASPIVKNAHAGPMSIGRAQSSAISISHPSVSRNHAVLHVATGMEIEDLGSANGTRVDGERVDPGQRVRVPLGAIIEVGAVRIVSRATAIAGTPPMGRMRDLVERVAQSDISVILVGESGSGKEVTASDIHHRSRRRTGPFLKLNCAAFPAQLLESELFGHERGAFTGALQSKPGLFETANGGTVLLDEIGELAPELQPKLLRVLENREVLRVGGLKPIAVDIRFIAATHRELEVLTVLGSFRHDLFFRLNGMTVRVPPLRERADEIGALAATLLAEVCERLGRQGPILSEGALEILRSYRWPGNVRELRNVLERAVLLCDGDRIDVEHLSFGRVPSTSTSSADTPRVSASPPSRAESSGERERVLDALSKCGGNQTEAAKLLGVTRRMLGYRLDKLGIGRPRKGH